MTTSETFRKQGNQIYIEAENTKKITSCALYQSKLEKAMQLYSSSITHATTSSEKASAYKNLGVLETKYANTHNIKLSESERNLIVFYNISSIQNIVYSLYHGEAVMELEWKEFMYKSLGNTLTGLIDGTKLLDKDLRLSWLRNVKSKLNDLKLTELNIGDKTIEQKFHLPACEIFFNNAITAHDANDYYQSSSLLHESQQYLGFIKKTNLNLESLQIMDELEERIIIQQCIIRSILMRQKAEKLYQELKDDSFSYSVDEDKVWDIIDLFVEAGLAARGKDLEQEAIAAAKIVVVFDITLKLNLRTLHYARIMHTLCESMKPRSFHGCSWHDTALLIYQRVQAEETRRIQMEEDEARERILAPIRPAIEKIKEAANSGAKALLIHLYLVHPPKSGEQLEQPVNDETIEKRFKKAFLHYHSDKQVNYDEQWQALSTEITKYLTGVYGKVCKGIF